MMKHPYVFMFMLMFMPMSSGSTSIYKQRTQHIFYIVVTLVKSINYNLSSFCVGTQAPGLYEAFQDAVFLLDLD